MSLSFPADDLPSFPAPARRRRRRRGRRSPVAATLVPVLVGTAVAVVALAGQSKVGAWLRGFLVAPRSKPSRDALARRVEGGMSLPALRDSILGRRKASIVATYGPPRTAVAAGGPVSLGQPGTFWQADTWYYAVDPRTQTAMAITFASGIAREVDFFDAPSGA